MNNTTLIIGNGFDLALKLKTSYRDFVNSDYWPITPTPANVHSERCLQNEVHMFTQEHIDPKSGEVQWIDIEGIIKDYALCRKEEENSPIGRVSEEIIKKEKKTQINKKADTSYIIAGICYNTCNIFTKDSKDNKACAGG